MTLIQDEDGVPIMHRTVQDLPVRSWLTWLIGRPLPTADAENQTIGKAIGLVLK